MDVDFLAGLIRDLLLEHDSLNLPGFGCFVAEEMPASFSDRGFILNPPYRRLGFVPEEGDDSLLSASYRQFSGSSGDDSELVHFLNEAKEQLMQNCSLVLPGLGRFKLTGSGGIMFMAEETLDISPDSCGLRPVSLNVSAPNPQNAQPRRSTPSAAKANPASAAAAPKPAAPANSRKRLPAFWRITLSLVITAAVLLGGFVALSRFAPDITDKLLYTPEELEILNYPEDGLSISR